MADTPAPPRVPAIEWTIREASGWLDPPIHETTLAALIRVAGIHPVGKRRLGHRGRPADTYDVATIMRLHAAFYSAFREWL